MFLDPELNVQSVNAQAYTETPEPPLKNQNMKRRVQTINVTLSHWAE
jgi:hypothetical protein